MSITAEVCEYFDNLIKPLVTNKSLKQLLHKFKEGIVSKFEDKLRGQNLKIQELESKIHSQKNAFKKLEIISDDNEQYSRRSCLRIHGIEFKEGDSGDVMEELEKCYNVMGIPFNENECMVSESPSWIRNGKGKLTLGKGVLLFIKLDQKLCKWNEETRLNIF